MSRSNNSSNNMDSFRAYRSVREAGKSLSLKECKEQSEYLPSPASIMSCTIDDTYCVCSDNTIWRWKNTMVVDDDYRSDDESIPKQLIFAEFSSIRIRHISCGGNHIVFTSNTGQIYSLGSNNYGELGLNDFKGRKTPCEITLPYPIISTSCGLNHSLVLTNQGIIYSFGRNDYGQLGTINDKCNIPLKIDSLDNVMLISASSYGHGSYCVTHNNIAYRWGTFYTQNIIEYEQYPIIIPYPLSLAYNEHIIIDFDLNSRPAFLNHNHHTKNNRYHIIGISAGTSHVLILTLSGEVYCMGLANSCLGLGYANHFNWIHTVTQMLLPSHALINAVAAAGYYSFLTTTNGDIYYCGDHFQILTPLLRHNRYTTTITEYTLQYYHDDWSETTLDEFNESFKPSSTPPFPINTPNNTSSYFQHYYHKLQKVCFNYVPPRKISHATTSFNTQYSSKTNDQNANDSFHGLILNENNIVITTGINGYCCVHVVDN